MGLMLRDRAANGACAILFRPLKSGLIEKLPDANLGMRGLATLRPIAISRSSKP
jgi:hypothetical protein